MLPILEEPEEILNDESQVQLSIFRTIAPTLDMPKTLGNLPNSNFSFHGLKGSFMQPSLLSGNKSWHNTASTANETNRESDVNTN